MKKTNNTTYLNMLIVALFGVPLLPLLYISLNHYISTNKEINFLSNESKGTEDIYKLYARLENESFLSNQSIKLLTEISKVGDESNLILDGSLDSYYLMNAIVVEIPMTIIQWSNRTNQPPTQIEWNELIAKVQASLQKAATYYQNQNSNALNVTHYTDLNQQLPSFYNEKSSKQLATLLWKGSQKVTTQLKLLIDQRLNVLRSKQTNALTITTLLAILAVSVSYLILRTIGKSRLNYETRIDQQQDLIEKGLRLATAGEVFASIGHDIASPLAVISASNDLMEKLANTNQSIESEKLRPYILKIRKMTLQSKSIIRNMRAILNNSDETYSSDTTLLAVANDLSDLVQPRLKKYGIELELKVPESENKITINVAAVLQILTNLVNNAADALANSPNKLVTLEIGQENNEVFFLVQDNGPGILPENAEKIFESLFTTKHNSGGTGLGLTISRRLANTMGGHLQLLPSQKGAKFELRIPVSTNTAQSN